MKFVRLSRSTVGMFTSLEMRSITAPTLTQAAAAAAYRRRCSDACTLVTRTRHSSSAEVEGDLTTYIGQVGQCTLSERFRIAGRGGVADDRREIGGEGRAPS